MVKSSKGHFGVREGTDRNQIRTIVRVLSGRVFHFSPETVPSAGGSPGTRRVPTVLDVE